MSWKHFKYSKVIKKINNFGQVTTIAYILISFLNEPNRKFSLIIVFNLNLLWYSLFTANSTLYDHICASKIKFIRNLKYQHYKLTFIDLQYYCTYKELTWRNVIDPGVIEHFGARPTPKQHKDVEGEVKSQSSITTYRWARAACDNRYLLPGELGQAEGQVTQA